MQRSKYGNIKETIDGITFDSKREANYYQTLKLLKRAGEIINIDFHPKYILQPAFWKCCQEVSTNTASKHICPYCEKAMPKTSAITYSADFRVLYSDGHVEVVDVKGIKTAVFNLKQKLFEFKNPNLTLRVIN